MKAKIEINELKYKIYIETKDEKTKMFLLKEYASSCEFKDSETMIKNIHISDIKENESLYKNIVLSNITKEDKKIIDVVYDKIKNINNIKIDKEDLQKFKSNIFDKMKISSSTSSEFSKITEIQLKQVYKSTRIENIANFSEPGSGKTLMTLMTHFERERELGKEIPLVIICPINAILVWKNEIKKFTKIEEKDIHIFKQDFEYENYMNKKFYSIANKKVIITNYSSMEKLDEDNFHSYCEKQKPHIVFDEIHRIKNPAGTKHSNAKKLIKNSCTRTILTGTPYSKTIGEIESLMNILWNYNIPSISPDKFISFEKEIRSFNEKKIKEFGRLIKPYYFSLKKSSDFNIKPAIDNFELPINANSLEIQLRIETFIFEKISKYILILKNDKNNIKIEKTLFKYYSFALMNSLDPSLLRNNKILIENNIDLRTLPNFKDLPKIKKAFEFVENYLKKEKKIIVWFRYKKNIKNFTNLLNEKGIKAKFIDGDTPIKDREEIFKRFSNPENNEICVLVSNPDTIAESISLHKSVFASLFVEQGFSLYQWLQAKDRIHRVGSNREVVHNYIRSNDLKIDKKVFENLKYKFQNHKIIFDSDNLIPFKLKNIDENDIEKRLFSEETNEEVCMEKNESIDRHKIDLEDIYLDN